MPETTEEQKPTPEQMKEQNDKFYEMLRKAPINEFLAIVCEAPHRVHAQIMEDGPDDIRAKMLIGSLILSTIHEHAGEADHVYVVMHQVNDELRDVMQDGMALRS